MKSVVHQQGDSRALWLLGGLYDIRVSGEETGGRFTVVEITVPPGLGAPPHVHEDADETVYVLEGHGRYHYEGQTVEAGPGAVLHFPKGTEEWFENSGDTPLKVLITYAPAGIDRFFQEVGEPAPSRTLPPPMDGPPDLERLQAVGHRYNLDLRPPPAA